MKHLNFLTGLFLLFFLSGSHTVFSQDSLSGDGLLIKAMKDEINRNLENLKEDEYEKPFFIAYTVSDINFSFCLSTLGALVNSASTRNKSWNARVIVGDYNINDENFNNTFQGASYDPGYEILPLDDDYWGIRRVFWIATNNIYKSAARNYSQKLKNLQENDIKYPLADFSKEKAVRFYDTATVTQPDISEIEVLGKNISEIFKGHPGIVNSGAYVSNISVVNYLVNSEGTEVRVPSNIASIYVDASVLGKTKMPKSTSIQYIANTTEALPSIDLIKKDVDILIENIKDTTETLELEDEYTGPVMLEGQAVAEFFISNLLNSGDNGLIAGRSNMTNSSKKDIEKYFEKLNEELKKEEENKIAASFINVKAVPFLDEFNGQQLLGSFRIDGEGVMPAEELILVEKGILKTKLNGRTPAIGVENSNGYNRFQVNSASVSKAIAPGVLFVSSDKTMPMDSLQLIFKKEAGEEDLDFGIKIKPLELNASVKPVDFLKFDFDKKTEEKLKISYVNYKQKNAMKKIVAVSDSYFVYNFLYKGGSGLFGGVTSSLFGDGIPVSIIVPSAIVVKDMDMSSYKGDDDIYEPAIKGPFEQ